MRCVNRGDPPQDKGGQPLQFNRSQEATPHLKQRLGRYCSFCERWIAANLAIEHKHPQSAAGHLTLTWSNFLLACSNCNSAKGAKTSDDTNVLWPDVDNTFGALTYQPTGRIQPNESASMDQHRRAKNLLTLVGLDRGPGEGPSDHRWFDRLEVWRLAQQSAEDIAETATAQMIARVVDTAAACGGFSIWMHVFAHLPQVREALVSRFPGTAFREQPLPGNT